MTVHKEVKKYMSDIGKIQWKKVPKGERSERMKELRKKGNQSD